MRVTHPDHAEVVACDPDGLTVVGDSVPVVSHAGVSPTAAASHTPLTSHGQHQGVALTAWGA